MPPIMPLNEVREGMTGTAYTVVDSSGVIKNFNVKIIGTIDNGKGSMPFIMAEASGDVINSTGGVLQGMSGSPVYINGKLIGALSRGWENLNPRVFLITPIENMLEIWNQPDNYNVNPYAQSDPVEETTEDSADDTNGESKIEEWKIIDADEDKISEVENAEIETAEDKATVVYSGFNGAGLNYLKNSMSEFGFKNFEIAAIGDSSTIDYNAELFPGSPVGAAVVVGDFVVGVTGTVTAVDDKKIIGFGHAFTHAGNVNFFMMETNVIGTVSGLTAGMKIASVNSIIGRINQDREAGVGGVIGQFPATVPISVTVNDDNYNAIISYNETLLPRLGAAVAYSALNKYVDNLGEGTVKINFDIKTDAVDSGTLSRENLFYNQADVGQLAVSELLQALTLVSSNTTAENNIYGIDVKMTVDPLRKTATLVKAEPDKKIVKPGEEVKLKVTLQPYRSREVVIEVPYKVPVTAKEGAFSLDIHGGGLVPVIQAAQTAQGVITPSTKPPTQLYNEKIQQLLTSNKNNELIIKPSAVVRTEKELKAEIKRAKKLADRLQKLGVKPTATSPTKFETDYVIDNVIQCAINVGKL